jgi:hypothetical protein
MFLSSELTKSSAIVETGWRIQMSIQKIKTKTKLEMTECLNNIEEIIKTFRKRSARLDTQHLKYWKEISSRVASGTTLGSLKDEENRFDAIKRVSKKGRELLYNNVIQALKLQEIGIQTNLDTYKSGLDFIVEAAKKIEQDIRNREMELSRLEISLQNQMQNSETKEE